MPVHNTKGHLFALALKYCRWGVQHALNPPTHQHPHMRVRACGKTKTQDLELKSTGKGCWGEPGCHRHTEVEHAICPIRSQGGEGLTYTRRAGEGE